MNTILLLKMLKDIRVYKLILFVYLSITKLTFGVRHIRFYTATLNQSYAASVMS